MAMRSITRKTSLVRNIVESSRSSAGGAVPARFYSGSGKILSEEERAAENVYIQRAEREKAAKLKAKAEKEKAAAEKENAKVAEKKS